MAISKLSIIKFLELTIAIACTGLVYKNGMTNVIETDLIAVGTFVGFVIILFGGFSGHLASSPITKRIDVFYCLVGCALFIASGALYIKHYENAWKGETRNYGLAIGSLAIINGACFLIDSLFTWRGEY